VRIKVDHCVYSKEEGGHFIYVALCVDDMLLVRNNMNEMKELKTHLSSKFDMKELSVSELHFGNGYQERLGS
jgi:hypothetical protein